MDKPTIPVSNFSKESNPVKITRIEQRLQDPTQFLMVTADEAASFGLPFLLGMLSKQAIAGVVVGFLVWFLWKRVKGDQGMMGFLASVYWFLPKETRAFGNLPDSSTVHWRA